MLLTNRVNQFFNNFFDDSFFNDLFFEIPVFEDGLRMKTDVKETEGGYMIDMELPGYAKEDIQAELKDGYLIIKANHNENRDEKDTEGNYIRRERYVGSCQRSFFVGKDVKQEDIRAAFRNGILRLAIPKKTVAIEEKSNYIAIE